MPIWLNFGLTESYKLIINVDYYAFALKFKKSSNT